MGRPLPAKRRAVLARRRCRAIPWTMFICSWISISACPAQETRYGTWERFFYKVQLPLKVAAPDTQVRLSLYHSYSSPLHDVRATGRSTSLTITQQPAALKELEPTEIQDFTFRIKRGNSGEAKQAALRIEFQARELPGTRKIEVSVPLTAGAEKELNEQLGVPVGTMEVKVGGWASQVYFLYIIPMLGLLGWLLWRRKRLAGL